MSSRHLSLTHGAQPSAPFPIATPLQIFWNAPAYHLEWQGQSVFAQVWGAGVLFFAANIASILALIRGHRFVPFTKAGQLVRLPASWWSGLEAERSM